MRKKLQFVATSCILAISTTGFSQTPARYLNNVFTTVKTTSDVIYGNNLSVLTGTLTPIDLKMDVYEPIGDTAMARPLVIILHSGAYLPAIANGSAIGKKTDSAVVEMCIRFAKKGYVAVAPDYRVGWNPTSTNQEVRTGTLLNANYRVMQDARNCVRYFRMDKAVTNTYKIDTNKIVMGGLGSGAFVALACGSFQRQKETDMAKFTNLTLTPPAKYVDSAIMGNVYGTDARPANTPNYPTYSSKIHMVFNCGGSIGDSTWIEKGEVPVVGFQCTKDPAAPYKTGGIYVSSTGAFVVEGTGNGDILRIINKANINNNKKLKDSEFNDVYTTNANKANQGYEGLYPFITPAPGAAVTCAASPENQKEQSAPWDWWSEAYLTTAYNSYSSTTNGGIVNCRQKLGNPDMSAAKGRKYIDTIQGYLAPRMVCALGLPGCVPKSTTIGIAEIISSSTVSVFPNPATSAINFSVNGANNIQSILLYNATGTLVKQVTGVNVKNYSIPRDGLISGFYIAQIQLSTGTVTKKIILE
jgi:hypothetical protein